jgi:hypothetical protein
MRRLVLFAIVVAIVATGVLTGAAIVKAQEIGHYKQAFSFQDTLCGFNGVTTVIAVDNYGSKRDGSTRDSGQLEQTFVAENGRGVDIKFDGGHLVNRPPVTNSDGTTTVVTIYDGLNVKTKAINGPVLEQGSGRQQVTVVYAANGDILSIVIVALSGQNPNLSGQPDCGVIAPYLAGA